MDPQRSNLVREVMSVLADASAQPRAITLIGDPGSGRTTLLQQLQVEVLAAGIEQPLVLDDCDRIDVDALQSARQSILLAGSYVPKRLEQALAARFEHHVFEIPALDDGSARMLLTELGVQPWSIASMLLLRRAEGNPRILVDGAFDGFEPQFLPQRDPSLDASCWTAPYADMLDLEHRAGGADLAAFAVSLEMRYDHADALAALAYVRLCELDYEGAVQCGEQAVAMADSSSAAAILGASAASAARSRRDEPMAMLSLHALAGRASRGSLPIVEAWVWQLIAWCAEDAGNHTAARSAVVRSILISDEHDATLLGLRARMQLASSCERSGDLVAAEEYRAEVARVADARGLLVLRASALAGGRHDNMTTRRSAPKPRPAHLHLVRSSTPDTGAHDDPAAFDLLTRREREIARYVAGGLTNPEIASELYLSPRTVEHHVSSILRKLELPSRRALVRGMV